jgi:Zn-dependent metalloprotease
MTVSNQERAAMARLLQIMNGEKPSESHVLKEHTPDHTTPVELAGAGQVTQRDISAMADVLRRLDSVVNAAHEQMITESAQDRGLKEALVTEPMNHGVKIGVYQIQQHVDETRVAGQQYYSVVNRTTGETLAHELSLYEAAHSLVKLLNQGKFFNSACVRELLESESNYTSHRIDAVRYHRMMKRAQVEGDAHKAQLMETRKQASMDRAMQNKTKVRKIYRQL